MSDYTPYVQQLLTSNSGKQPNIVEQILPPEDDVGIIGGLTHQGFKGTDFNFLLYYPCAAGVAKGSDTLVTFAPWEQKTPAVASFRPVQNSNPTRQVSWVRSYFWIHP